MEKKKERNMNFDPDLKTQVFIEVVSEKMADEYYSLEKRIGDYSEVLLQTIDLWRSHHSDWMAFYVLKMAFEFEGSKEAYGLLSLIEESDNQAVVGAFLDAFCGLVQDDESEESCPFEDACVGLKVVGHLM